MTYCGVGVAASSAAFALGLLGVDGVAVYDGSMFEWAGGDLEAGHRADRRTFCPELRRYRDASGSGPERLVAQEAEVRRRP